MYIEGRLQTRSWDDKQTGQKKYMTEVVVNDLVLLGGRGEGGGGGDFAGGSRGAASGGNNFDQRTPGSGAGNGIRPHQRRRYSVLEAAFSPQLSAVRKKRVPHLCAFFAQRWERYSDSNTMNRLFIAGLLCLFLFPHSFGLCQASPSPSRRRGQDAGQFDYYLLALSWAPNYCAGHPSDHSSECRIGGHTAFVLHGLWPQANSGPPPMSCSTAPPGGGRHRRSHAQLHAQPRTDPA